MTWTPRIYISEAINDYVVLIESGIDEITLGRDKIRRGAYKKAIRRLRKLTAECERREKKLK